VPGNRTRSKGETRGSKKAILVSPTYSAYDKLDIRNLIPSSGLGSNDSGDQFQVESEQVLYNSRFAASASFAMLMSNALNSGGWPMNSPDAIRKFAAPSASICPGEVGRITAQRGKFGLMNSQGTGKIRLV
jgi:hypothetical protein